MEEVEACMHMILTHHPSSRDGLKIGKMPSSGHEYFQFKKNSKLSCHLYFFEYT